MSEVKEDLLYTKDHEWIRIEGDEAFVGITDYAQSELGEIVFVELPAVGSSFEKESVFGSVEAVKAVSDLFLPMSGSVLEVNQELEDKPELVNESPYENGWMIKLKLKDLNEAAQLLSSDAYSELIK